RDRNVTGVQTCALPICSSANHVHIAASEGCDATGASGQRGKTDVIHVSFTEGCLDPAILIASHHDHCSLAGSQFSTISTPVQCRSEERRVGKERPERET